MFKITIKNLQGEETNGAVFQTEAELLTWKDHHVSIGTFAFPETHHFTIVDISSEEAAKAAVQAKIEAGATAREVCQKVLDYVAGENLDRSLTIEQITDLQQTFAQAEASLRAGRPTYAKYFISAIEADGVLVTQEMKNTCLGLLSGY